MVRGGYGDDLQGISGGLLTGCFEVADDFHTGVEVQCAVELGCPFVPAAQVLTCAFVTHDVAHKLYLTLGARMSYGGWQQGGVGKTTKKLYVGRADSELEGVGKSVVFVY